MDCSNDEQFSSKQCADPPATCALTTPAQETTASTASLRREAEDLETAVRRIVFKETKTNLRPVVPVALIKVQNHEEQHPPTAILVARTDGEVQIKPDEKTRHRYMSEVTLLLHPGYRNKQIKKLYEAARQTLVCEEIRIDHKEETQCGKEKYNLWSLQ